MRTRWALIGVDLDLEEHKSKRKEMEKRADARRQGMLQAEQRGEQYVETHPDDVSLADLGIEIEVEGE